MESRLESGHLLPNAVPKDVAAHYTGYSLIVEHDDEKMMAFFMRESMLPEMPCFAGRFRPGMFSLYLSEEVPADFQPYLVWHEAHCEVRDYPIQENVCHDTLVAELALVPEQIRNAYIAFRLQYYTRLRISAANFSGLETRRRPSTPLVVERAKECIDYLNALCAERAST